MVVKTIRVKSYFRPWMCRALTNSSPKEKFKFYSTKGKKVWKIHPTINFCLLPLMKEPTWYKEMKMSQKWLSKWLLNRLDQNAVSFYWTKIMLLEAHVICTLHIPLYFIILEKFVTSEFGPFFIHIYPISLQIYLQPSSVTNHVPITYPSFISRTHNFLSHVW